MINNKKLPTIRDVDDVPEVSEVSADEVSTDEVSTDKVSTEFVGLGVVT